MFKLGDFNELKIVREKEFGVFLDAEVGEILLPQKYVPKEAKIGDVINVFVYKDSEDRYVATTLEPKAKVGDYAYLQVKDTNKYGAFLDWGLEKDLLVPFNHQAGKLAVGENCVVKICIDNVTNRIIGSQKINKFIDEEQTINLKEGQEVDLLVYNFTDLGVQVIINNTYLGLLYKNEVYKKMTIGDRTKGYVKKIREDKKIDVTIRKGIVNELEDSRTKIIWELERNGGFLDITDKSSPEEIKDRLGMSKGLFKKAIGGLYKERLIELGTNGITLNHK